MKLYYQPNDIWIGDCMPFYDNGKFYLFHQRDKRNPGPLFASEPFGWSLVTTTDFIHYEDFGEVIKRGSDEDQDQFIFAGNIFKRDDAYDAIYTGFNRDYHKYGKPSQVLMKATSVDLIHWNKSSEKLVAPQPGYDPNEWRDPYIFWNEDDNEYVMILGSRESGKNMRTGCVVYFTSPDLNQWVFKGNLWAPNRYYVLEMPDMFKMGDWWYLLATEYTGQNKTHYRMSKSITGPWIAPVDDAFDGRAYYAARSHSDGEKRYIFGWVPTRGNRENVSWAETLATSNGWTLEGEDTTSWAWAGTLVAQEIFQREDGSLGTKAPDSILNAFCAPEGLICEPKRLMAKDACKEKYLVENSGDLYKFETTIAFNEGTRLFGIRLYDNKENGSAYEYVFNVGENKISFDKTPNYPFLGYVYEGVERPFKFEAGREYKIIIIVDDSVSSLYIEGVALNARMNSKPGNAISMYVVDGDLTVNKAVISRNLKDSV